MRRLSRAVLALALSLGAMDAFAVEYLSEAGMRELLREAQADDPDDPCLPYSFAPLRKDFVRSHETLIRKCELDFRVKALGPDHISVGWALERLGNAYRQESQDPKTAAEFLERAVAHKERVEGPDAASLRTALESLGFAYRDLDRFADAEAVLRRALVLSERDAPRWALAAPLYSLGIVVLAQHRAEEAERLFRRSLDSWDDKNSPMANNITLPLVGLARALLEQGKLAQADATLMRATKVFDERGLAPNHWARTESLKTLAALREAQKRPNAAAAVKRQLLAIDAANPRAHRPITPMPWEGLSVSAWDIFDGILQMVEGIRGSDHPDLVPHLYVFGYALQQDKRIDGAELCYKRALEIREKTQPPDSPKVAASREVLASLYHSQGRLEEARSLRARAPAIQKNTP